MKPITTNDDNLDSKLLASLPPALADAQGGHYSLVTDRPESGSIVARATGFYITHDELNGVGDSFGHRWMTARHFLARRLVDDANEAPLLRAEICRLHGEIDRLNALLAEICDDAKKLSSDFNMAFPSEVPASIASHPDSILHSDDSPPPLRIANDEEFGKQSAKTLGIGGAQ